MTTTALVLSILADRPPANAAELDRNLRNIESLFVLQMAGAPLLAGGFLMLIIWGVWAKRQPVAIGVILAAAIVFGLVGYSLAEGQGQKLASGPLEDHRALVMFAYILMNEFTSPLIFLGGLATALVIFLVSTRYRPAASAFDWAIVTVAATVVVVETYALARIVVFLTKVGSFFGPVR